MTTLRLMRVHWLRWGQTGTACGLGGLVSDRTPDLTCRECIRLAAIEDERMVRVRLSRRTQTRIEAGDDEARDPWKGVRGREF